LSRFPDGRFVSFFGDLHPSYFVNVVKSLASARQGYPVVSHALAKSPPRWRSAPAAFFVSLAGQLLATVHKVERLTPTIVEVVGRAPLAARKFRPGQFYRLQKFETLSPVVTDAGATTRLQMEGLAMTGAWVDRDRGLVSTIVLEMGGSSDLCAMLEPGEPVILMGPTGSPTHIASGETVILVGGGLGNAVLFSIGAAFRARGSINSPMQCMLKEICAQCLQPHRDPHTGKRSYVFSCFNQDQELDSVDFGALSERLRQNSLQEKITAQWILHCMPELRKQRTL